MSDVRRLQDSRQKLPSVPRDGTPKSFSVASIGSLAEVHDPPEQFWRNFGQPVSLRGSGVDHWADKFLGRLTSGTKNEPKPKLLSPDIFWWGGGLPREGVGAKKFGMSLENQGIKLFWRDIPGFRRDIPEAPEKFEKKMFGFHSRPL